MSKVELKVVDVEVVLTMNISEARALRDELGAQINGSREVYFIFDKLDDALKTLPTVVVE